MEGVLALRERVFVREQGVPSHLERDALDAAAIHLVATRAGAVIGCCRLVFTGREVRLGRMAVAAEERGRGVGAELLAYAHRVARAAGAVAVELHAQLGAQGFYARMGYRPLGERFEEAGIVHVAMRRSLDGGGHEI